MQSTIALRSYLMAGVAVAGAGIIAVNPVQPLAPAKAPVVQAEVSLSAFATGSVIGAAVTETCDQTWKCSDPGDFYTAVWNNTVFGVTAVWNEFAAAPFPIATNALTNLWISAQIAFESIVGTTQSISNAIFQTVPTLVTSGFNNLFSGNFLGASNDFTQAIFAPIKPLIDLPKPLALVGANPIYNIGNVLQAISTPEAVTNALLGVSGPLISVSGGLWTAVQNIYSSIVNNSWTDALNWVINTPGILFDSLVNGGYGPVLYSFDAPGGPYNYVAGGLLNPEKFFDLSQIGGTGFQVTSRGSVSSLLKERSYVSGALCPSGPCTNPTPPFTAASTPAVAAATPAVAAAAAATAPAPEVEAAVQQDAPKIEAPKVGAPAAALDIELPAADPVAEVPAPAPSTDRSEVAVSNDAPAPSADAGVAKPHRTSPRGR